MKYYFAPMEGITGYVFRNAHHQFYDQIAQYVTPFITPNQNRTLTSRELHDVLPEHNRGLSVVPQILSNKADEFLWAAGKLQEMGYEEVNLNLGCPSPTVVSKRRGAGFLEYPAKLDAFLWQVSERMGRMGMKLSIKTRIGKYEPEEFEELLRIYNQYPLTRLVIHPRVQEDFYKNHPNRQVFGRAVRNSRNPVCYNGDLFSVEEIAEFHQQFPDVEEVMLGRGLLTNPMLAAQAQLVLENALRQETDTAPIPERVISASGFDRCRFRAFHDALLAGYREAIPGDRNVLFKMKELWCYMGDAFADSAKYVKKIRKAEKMGDYQAAVSRIFEECAMAEPPVFQGWK